MKENKKVYLKIFLSMFYLSMFTFGGGYVIVSLMKSKFVDELKWIDEKEMLDAAAIAQSSPGAVAVNAAILVGYRVAGVGGAVVAIIGTVLPPLIIISIISFCYTAFRSNYYVGIILKAMQAGVAAVIFDVVLKLGGDVVKSKDVIYIIVMVLAFVATYVLNINVLYIILVCGIIGALKMRIMIKKEKEK